MKKILIILSISLIIGLLPANNNKTWQECLVLTKQYNRDLKIAKEKIKSAKAQKQIKVTLYTKNLVILMK